MVTKKKPSTKITKQDQKDWQDFIKNIKSVEDKDLKDEKPVINNNFFFDIKIDLHGFKVKDAFEKVSESIDLAIDTKKRKILFITGKGLHSNYEADPYASKDLRLLKYAIPEFIKNEYRNKIVSIKEAPQKYGGDGAIIVFLKK